MMEEPLNLIVTGATSDIGSAVAERVDRIADASMLLVSRSAPVVSLHERHRVISGVDLARSGDVVQIRTAAAEHFVGPFTLLHCVGGFWNHKPLTQTEHEEIVEMASSHYLTLASTVWALLPEMVRRGGGRIIALSCNSVAYAYPDMSPFTAAKAAVEMFVKCIANEYAAYGISATAIALPTILTSKVKQSKPNGDHRNYVTPAEVTDVVLQLARSAPILMSGNVIKLFRHSPTFFNDGYFERNPRRVGITPDDVHVLDQA